MIQPQWSRAMEIEILAPDVFYEIDGYRRAANGAAPGL